MDEIIIKLGNSLSQYAFKKQLGQRTGMIQGIDGYAQKMYGKDILQIVKRHAKVVSGAAVAQSVPGGFALGTAAVVASTWKMYYDINKTLGISFSENFLKSVASGVVSNLASNGVALAGMNMLSWIPGVGTLAAIGGGMAINRVAIHTAAVSYLKILNGIAKEGGSFSESAVKSRMSYA